ncbi:glycoside hydrolase family 2 protein [Nonomuraea salmonea]|uniref:glycoside hydrolase family 2 protein n=1 Tax=Nonomuraea salmonea TaxID=46181 RepID=UPI0031EB2E6E
MRGQAVDVTVHGTPGTATVIVRDGRRVIGTAHGKTGKKLRVPVRKPKLWSPDSPHLYDLEVRLKGDKVESYFGMREITLSGNRMLLNGKPVFQIGPLDQGFWPDGIYTAPTDEALRHDLEQTKALGFNAVRKHVKVEPDRWYHYADKLGLLVWQDMPSAFRTDDRQQFETELRAMIDQHRSSPSIVMWVPFNEGWGQYDQARIADLVKSWDPSRLVNNMSGVNCCGRRGRRQRRRQGLPHLPGPRQPRQARGRPRDRDRRVRRPGPAARRPHLVGRRLGLRGRARPRGPHEPLRGHGRGAGAAARLRAAQRRHLHPDDGRRDRDQRPHDVRQGDHQARRQAPPRRPQGADQRDQPHLRLNHRRAPALCEGRGAHRQDLIRREPR